MRRTRPARLLLAVLASTLVLPVLPSATASAAGDALLPGVGAEAIAVQFGRGEGGGEGGAEARPGVGCSGLSTVNGAAGDAPNHGPDCVGSEVAQVEGCVAGVGGGLVVSLPAGVGGDCVVRLDTGSERGESAVRGAS